MREMDTHHDGRNCAMQWERWRSDGLQTGQVEIDNSWPDLEGNWVKWKANENYNNKNNWYVTVNVNSYTFYDKITLLPSYWYINNVGIIKTTIFIDKKPPLRTNQIITTENKGKFQLL